MGSSAPGPRVDVRTWPRSHFGAPVARMVRIHVHVLFGAHLAQSMPLRGPAGTSTYSGKFSAPLTQIVRWRPRAVARPFRCAPARAVPRQRVTPTAESSVFGPCALQGGVRVRSQAQIGTPFARVVPRVPELHLRRQMERWHAAPRPCGRSHRVAGAFACGRPLDSARSSSCRIGHRELHLRSQWRRSYARLRRFQRTRRGIVVKSGKRKSFE